VKNTRTASLQRADFSGEFAAALPTPTPERPERRRAAAVQDAGAQSEHVG